MARSRRVATHFLKASKALKAAGEKGLRNQLHSGMKKTAKPLLPAARRAAKAQLPQRGGLAKAVASSKMRTQVLTGRNKYGVRITVGKNKRAGARDTNRGKIRHPVFGDTQNWVDQEVPAGWFDDTMRDGAPAIRKEAHAAVGRALDDIARRGRR